MATIRHPLHPLDRAVMIAMREMVAPMKGSVTGPEARKPFDEWMEKTRSSPGVTYEQASVGGVAGVWCRPEGAVDPAAAILYFHGGAYIAGSALAYRHFVGQIAARTRIAAFVPAYGLAPERPFPAAVDDAQAAYAGLVAQGVTSIALAGDSAGGGLALALLSLAVAKAKDGLIPAPLGAVAMSPWTDLALTGDSMASRAEADPLTTQQALATTAQLYLGKHDPRDARASPLYADLAQLPPILIHVGEDEVLLDDSTRYGDRVENSGGVCQVNVWESMVHVFPSNVSTLHAAKAALDDIGDFLRRCFKTEPDGASNEGPHPWRARTPA
ncbi:alpha/beta hydrolase [Ideonella azotifigens]|uniref:Alpha/beta hydrolase n=1 Tax=Ideonella azotifigens TaxID=513160 RepID=A0ABP3VQS9_9BURK|nr:alpha/beta hydrolase fold domain-containing protein [Ideonella azotifigens]MCD2344937.1 alpha/beta hydrolase [Ideonella azotifigens]